MTYGIIEWKNVYPMFSDALRKGTADRKQKGRKKAL
jgi:hypothetical protein